MLLEFLVYLIWTSGVRGNLPRDDVKDEIEHTVDRVKCGGRNRHRAKTATPFAAPIAPNKGSISEKVIDGIQ